MKNITIFFIPIVPIEDPPIIPALLDTIASWVGCGAEVGWGSKVVVNIGVVDSLVLVLGIIDTVCVVFSELVVGAVGSAVSVLVWVVDSVKTIFLN